MGMFAWNKEYQDRMNRVLETKSKLQENSKRVEQAKRQPSFDPPPVTGEPDLKQPTPAAGENTPRRQPAVKEPAPTPTRKPRAKKAKPDPVVVTED